ncbi:MAG: ABC transporter ATP-binding protein [Planctomycetes bacterium]|nr:ABC transporter ATP-binding protein [Planctomycetota bacterium]
MNKNETDHDCKADCALNARVISFAYGRHPIFDKINVSFPRGKFNAILGPNGCGKTTLLSILSGFFAPSNGEVIIDGSSLGRLDAKARARLIAYVPQTPVMAFPFTVREIVSMGRHPYLARFAGLSPQDWQAVDEALDILDLNELSGSLVTELSGGERQRVVLARALAQESEILLLDEPTSNLDIRHALDILSRVRKRISERGITVVAVMHDLNLAAMFADHCLFLNKGKAVCSGEMDKVFNRENIAQVYDINCEVEKDQESGRPVIKIKERVG